MNVVILLKWSREENSNQVHGTVESYVRDSTGNPTMRQRLVSDPPSVREYSAALTQNRQFYLHLIPQTQRSR